MVVHLFQSFYQWHTVLGTVGMVGGGGGEGSIYAYILFKNGFLTNCLLYGHTKVCCYK